MGSIDPAVTLLLGRLLMTDTRGELQKAKSPDACTFRAYGLRDDTEPCWIRRRAKPTAGATPDTSALATASHAAVGSLLDLEENAVELLPWLSNRESIRLTVC